eukprot:711611-Prymnesium_polylepis.1
MGVTWGRMGVTWASHLLLVQVLWRHPAHPLPHGGHERPPHGHRAVARDVCEIVDARRALAVKLRD